MLTLETGKRCSVGFHRNIPTIATCRFELGRKRAPDGSETRFTGCPRRWSAILGAPSGGFDADRVVTCLRSFSARHQGRVELQYTRLIARRLVIRAGCEPCHRSVDVWALSGRVWGAGGRVVPIGWSGIGEGFDRLENPTLNERFDHLVAMVDRAEALEAGSLPVVLSTQAAAVLVHESIGHFAEGAIESGRDLSHRLGCRVAAEGFTVVDDPDSSEGAVRYIVDDEGIERLGPTEIVRDGLLVAQLHSRASAAGAGTLTTGNGRAALWAPPIPRMSNLICCTGDVSEEELVDQLGRGLIVHHLAHGFGLGITVEARVVLAQEVAFGKPTGRYLTDGRVVDRVGLMIRAVALSTRRELNPNAMCGKAGQMLFDVGTTAPAMRLTHLEFRA